MKKNLLILALLLIGSASVFAQAKKVTSVEGRYSIALPKDFTPLEATTEPVTTNDSTKLLVHIQSYYDAKGNVLVVSYNDYPDSTFIGLDEKVMLDFARDGAINNMKGVIEKQSNFTQQGAPAKSVHYTSVSDGKNYFNLFQCAIARPRLYQLIFLGLDKKERDTKKIKNMMKSFTLIK